MTNFTEILKYYETSLHKFQRGIVREYLQYLILNIIFTHPLSRKLSFLGGTCLRVVHKLPRFSEDIDFDNKDITLNEFKELSNHIKRKLEEQNYIVEIRVIRNNAFHCYIRFPHMLYNLGFSPIEEEKILVQLDTFDQGVEYESEIFILDKFDLFQQIKVTPKSIILAQKLWSITQRKRAKGRDFFDAMFLMQNTKPDSDFLEKKFKTKSFTEIKKSIQVHIKDIDLVQLSKELLPFLINPQDAEKIKLFPQFLDQYEV